MIILTMNFIKYFFDNAAFLHLVMSSSESSVSKQQEEPLMNLTGIKETIVE